MPDVCVEDDWYVRNIPRWVVVLSDGTTAYGDDGREGVAEPSAWVRLKAHCEASGLGIAEMLFQFRSNIVRLPGGRPGYFFARVASGTDGGCCFNGVRIGHVDGGVVRTTHHRVPDLAVVDRDVRPADYDSPCMIRGAACDVQAGL